MWLVEKYRKKQRKFNEETASMKFQIMEHDGEVWFTFNNALVCPCSMFNLSAVDAVKKMRELYLKRMGFDSVKEEEIVIEEV